MYIRKVHAIGLVAALSFAAGALITIVFGLFLTPPFFVANALALWFCATAAVFIGLMAKLMIRGGKRPKNDMVCNECGHRFPRAE